MNTRKSITNSSSVTAAKLKTSSGSVSVTSPAPSAGYVLTATSANTATWAEIPLQSIGEFQDDRTFIVDITDNTKALAFDVNGTSNTITMLRTNQTTDRNIYLPDASTTLIGGNTTDTFTNKTITDTSNNIAANSLRSTSGLVDVAAASAPTTGQTLIATGATTATWQTIPAAIAGQLVDANTFILDSVDATKRLAFDVNGTIGTTTTLASAPTSNRTVTLPNANTTLVGRDTTDTFANKTITSVSNTVATDYLKCITGLVTVASAPAPLVGQVLRANSAGGGGGTARWETIPPAVAGQLVDANTFILDSTDATKRIGFDAGGTTGTTTTIFSTQTVDRNIVLPDASTTLIGTGTTDTLTNKTITAVSNNVAANLLKSATGVVDVAAATAPTTGQILRATGATTATWQAIPAAVAGQLVDANTFILDSVDATKRLAFDVNGTTGTTTTLTAAQTTNRVITLPDANATLVGVNTVDFLLNKTITDTTNVVTASSLRVATGVVNISAATAPTVGQVLRATAATTATWQTLAAQTNGNFTDTSTFIIDSVTASIRIGFNAGGTAATTTTLTTAQTANRIVNIPDANTTLIGTDTTDVLTNKTIVATSNSIAADFLKVTGGGLVSLTAASAPTAGQLLTAVSGTVASWQTPVPILTGSIVASLTSLGTGQSPASLTVTFECVKVGSIVTLTIPRTTGSWTNITMWFGAAGILPVGYRPLAQVAQVFSTFKGTGYDQDVASLLILSTDGSLVFRRAADNLGGITWSSVTQGWDGFSISYSA